MMLVFSRENVMTLVFSHENVMTLVFSHENVMTLVFSHENAKIDWIWVLFRGRRDGRDGKKSKGVYLNILY